MSIFQISQIKQSKVLGVALLLAVISSVALFTPAQAHDSLKTVLSKRVVGKTVILTVRDMATGKIETITGQAGRDNLAVMKDPAKATLPTQPIERVKAGQWVPTRNPLTGKTEYKQVKRTFVHTVPTIVALRLADTKTGEVLETLKGTPEHPFFTTDKGTVGMGHLRVGEKVVSRVGPALMVASVVPESKPGGYRVYNFEVSDDHTYFVGKANGGTWVHNTCNVAELIGSHSNKLKSILARRGGDWGFSGNVTSSQVRDFAQAISDHVANADEVWQAPYRGSDRLFHIIGDKVVVTHLDGTFESAWRATADQLAHYRTGVQIK